MNENDTSPPVAWSVVEMGLETMTPVDGGFSLARRGLVNLPDGDQVFVKIGTEENSVEWAKKEIAVYRYLKVHGYSAIPELRGTNQDQTAFVLDALTPQEGWDWTDTWSVERLEATLQAVDELAALRPAHEDFMSMGQSALDESRDGWIALNQSPDLQQALRDKLHAARKPELAKTLDVAKEFDQSTQFVFRTNTFVHYDIRADNCAWNADTKQVKFVDWNWAQYGDARIDAAAMLTHVQKAGLDILRSHKDRLDAGALQWMAGFWLKAAATPIWHGGPPHLRDFQLQAGLTALELSRKL